MIHNLKCWPIHFNSVIEGLKTAELRINDRNFKLRDFILLQEYDNIKSIYTGREILLEITHITNGTNHLKDNCVMLSFKIVPLENRINELQKKLLNIAEKEINQTKSESWLGQKPERWFDNPTWRCINNHISKRYLKSEEKGAVCLKCGQWVVLTFPEDKDGELEI